MFIMPPQRAMRTLRAVAEDGLTRRDAQIAMGTQNLLVVEERASECTVGAA